MKTTIKNIIGVKELRNNLQRFITLVERGQSFTVVRRSKPVFTISPTQEDDSLWEEVIDFTKIKKGGVRITDVLSRL